MATITAAAVARAAGTRLEMPITGVDPVDGYAHNNDFLVRTRADEFILKATDRAAVAAEAWACEQARAADVGAPEVVVVDLECTLLPRAYLLERRLAGTAVRPGDTRVITQVGRQLRRLHQIPGAGFGFLAQSRQLPHAPLASWRAVIDAPLHQLDAMTDAGVLPTGWAERLRSLVAAVAPERSTSAGVLLHGDLDPRHLFAENGRLTGIIDWGDCLIGDPVFDLARFTRTEHSALDALLAGYDPDPQTDLHRAITFYRAVWTLIDLDVDFTDGDTNWLPEHLSVLDHVLHEFDA